VKGEKCPPKTQKLKNSRKTNMTIEVKDAYEAFISAGIDMFTGVPDSLLKNFCAYITDTALAAAVPAVSPAAAVPAVSPTADVPAVSPAGTSPRPVNHIIAANEGNAVGIAAGHYLATGRPALVYMQNSGLGNTVNPLLSLADEKVYSIPMVLMIGWRGEPGVHDEPQHVKQGEVTLPLLDAMRIPYIILESAEQIAPQVELAMQRKAPVAIVIRKGIFGTYKLKNVSANSNPLSREEAMKLVVDHLHDTDVIVSTTGKLSRELFEYREACHQGHGHDFLTVGSMGHSSSIALGIALQKPDRRVMCFDGDGAFIMHTGALGIVASMKPKNFVHILFNNGAHESVGGQPTIGYQIDAVAMAKASGYAHAMRATTREEMADALKLLEHMEGPVLLELRVKTGSRDDLGRPTTTPIENKEAFMTFLNQR